MNNARNVSINKAQDVQEVLAGLVSFSEYVTIYVPGTNGVSAQADNSEWVDKTMTFLSKLFGGATAIPVQGAWVADGGMLVKENTVMVKAFCEKLTGDAVSKVIDMCQKIRWELQQEAVGLEVNGSMYFV